MLGIASLQEKVNRSERDRDASSTRYSVRSGKLSRNLPCLAATWAPSNRIAGAALMRDRIIAGHRRNVHAETVHKMARSDNTYCLRAPPVRISTSASKNASTAGEAWANWSRSTIAAAMLTSSSDGSIAVSGGSSG